MSNLVINETPGFDLEDMVQLFERHIAHGTFAFLRRGSISFRDEEEYEEEGEGNEADTRLREAWLEGVAMLHCVDPGY